MFNASKTQNDGQWQMAAATWYGAPDSGGSDGEYYQGFKLQL